jgi:hypothetical protein
LPGFGILPNCYAIQVGFEDGCHLVEEEEYHYFDLPQGAIQPVRREYANVYGCGLLQDTDDNLAIFFTLNGKLLSKLLSRKFGLTCKLRNEINDKNF